MLDGNATAGILDDIFGADMTVVVSTCGGCGSRAPLAETAVYLRAPGVVVRCRRCDNVLVVVIERGGAYCVDMCGIGDLARDPNQ